jgi:hypothetical protein
MAVTQMEVFPKLSVISSDNPIVETINFKNIKVGYGDMSQERVKQKWEYPKRDLNLKYTWISKADARTIWNFYLARGGSWEAFLFFYNFISVYEDEFVAITNGFDNSFILPSVAAINYTLYLNNVQLNAGSDYFFYSEGAIQGMDFVDMAVAPDAGSILTWSFTGKLVTRCRFEDDLQNFETFHNRLSKMGIKLKGLLLSEEFGVPVVTTTTSTTTTTT